MMASLQPEIAQRRMIIRTPSQGPPIFAGAFIDRRVVDARNSHPHQAFVVELSVPVPVGAAPLVFEAAQATS
jgi:hypothetical protein